MRRRQDPIARPAPRTPAIVLTILASAVGCGQGTGEPLGPVAGGVVPSVDGGAPVERTVDGLRRRALALAPGAALTIDLPPGEPGRVLTASLAAARPATTPLEVELTCRGQGNLRQSVAVPAERPRWISRRFAPSPCGNGVRIELRSSPGPHLLLADLLLSPPAETVSRDRPSVILVSLDTTRADRLEAILAEGPVPASVERLRGRATIFENARSTSSWTLPAHASLFSGLLPSEHGAISDPGLELTARRPSPSSPSLPERLLRDGVHTMGVAAGPYLRREYGLDRGFLLWSDLWEGEKRRAREVNRIVASWLDVHGDRPFFLFVHYFDAHAPYDPEGWGEDDLVLLRGHGIEPRTFQADDLEGRRWPGEVRDALRARYDGEIRAIVRGLGELLDLLESRGLLDSSLIVVVGDHGESFGERTQWGHGGRLYDEQARVPLWVRRPGQIRGESRPEPVGLARVPGWIAAAAGVPWPEAPSSRPPDVVVAERRFPAVWHRMIVLGEHKLLRERPLGGGPAADTWLRTGPGPDEPGDPPPDVRRILTAAADTLPDDVGTALPEAASAREDLLESLRTLGYLD